jgi:hypothetical protein
MTEKKNTALAKLSPEGEAVVRLSDMSKRFAEEYAAELKEYSEQVPTPETFQTIVSAIAENEEVEGAEDMAFALSEIIQQTSSQRAGMFAKEDRVEFPELRIFHGAGNDPNRPEDQIPGTMYLNTCESVGKSFTGAVIAIWKGRTMWGNKDAGESTAAPICSSMNRVVGSEFGDCARCPEKPWRDGQKTRCGDDVIAFVLSEKLNRLVLVRFAKTSEPAGKRLFKLLKLCATNWSKWFELTLDKQENDRNVWYALRVQPANGGGDAALTPPIIHPFCEALMNNLSASFVLPGIARIYSQADSAMAGGGGGDESTGGNAEPVTMSDVQNEGVDEENYGVMPDVGDDSEPNV